MFPETPEVHEYQKLGKKLTKAEARAEAYAVAWVILNREIANGLLAEDAPEVVDAMEELLRMLSRK